MIFVHFGHTVPNVTPGLTKNRWQEKTARMEKKTQSKPHGRRFADAALEKIEEAIKAVESCEGKLTTDGYRQLRAQLGHLMDALYKVGGSLAKST